MMNCLAVRLISRWFFPALVALLTFAGLPAHAQKVTNPIPNPLICNPTGTLYSNPLVYANGSSNVNIRVRYFQIDGGNVSDFRIISENFTSSSASRRSAVVLFTRTAPGPRVATLTISGQHDIWFRGRLLAQNVPFTEKVTLKDN